MNDLLNKGYVSIDSAPANSICEWCGDHAIQRYLVTGGIFHNQTGLFCGSCGEMFTCNIERSSKSREARTERISMSLQDRMSRATHNEVFCEQDMWNAGCAPEDPEEHIITLKDYKRWVGGTYAQ